MKKTTSRTMAVLLVTSATLWTPRTVVADPKRPNYRPKVLMVTGVICYQTEDLVGKDDLYFVVGGVKYLLGRFKEGDSKDLAVQADVPSGVSTMEIFEHDDTDPDDKLGTVDLRKDMDIERIFGVTTGRARYNVKFKVLGGSE